MSEFKEGEEHLIELAKAFVRDLYLYEQDNDLIGQSIFNFEGNIKVCGRKLTIKLEKVEDE